MRETSASMSHAHREVFDRELGTVKEGVFRMGALVETAIDSAVGCLVRQDVAGAAAVIAGDRAVNEAQKELTTLITATIATQAPVARDLRFLMSLAHVTYELERIGDHAVGVARHVRRLGPGSPTTGSASLAQIGELASSLLHGVLKALVDLDQAEARLVAQRDDEVDRLYHAFFTKCVERMRTDPSWVDVGALLLFAAHDLERIGDRVTNIAEDVVFLATGEIEDLNP